MKVEKYRINQKNIAEQMWGKGGTPSWYIRYGNCWKKWS